MKFWKRKIWIAPIWVWAILIAGTAFAAMIIIFNVGITGNIYVAAPPVVSSAFTLDDGIVTETIDFDDNGMDPVEGYVAGGLLRETFDIAHCAAVASTTTVDVVITDGWYGSTMGDYHCSVGARFTNTTGTDLEILGVTLLDGTVLDAAMFNGCGKPLMDGDVDQMVVFDLWVLDGAAEGAFADTLTFDFAPLGTGVCP